MQPVEKIIYQQIEKETRNRKQEHHRSSNHISLERGELKTPRSHVSGDSAYDILKKIARLGYYTEEGHYWTLHYCFGIATESTGALQKAPQ